MWEYEYRSRTTVGAEQIWRRWVDVTTWPNWNAGVASVAIEGPFAVGTRFAMTAPDGEVITLRLAEIDEGRCFVDELDAGDFVVRTEHRLEADETGTTVVYRTEIAGPAAAQVGPELGPHITVDFPEVVAALVREAAA